MLKQHDKCALHDEATKQKGTGLDFIWTHYMQSIMNILYKDLTPTPEMVLDDIITETKAQISARPKCPVSIFLKRLLNNANVQTN